eukprot:g47069.t1
MNRHGNHSGTSWMDIELCHGKVVSKLFQYSEERLLASFFSTPRKKGPFAPVVQVLYWFRQLFRTLAALHQAAGGSRSPACSAEPVPPLDTLRLALDEQAVRCYPLWLNAVLPEGYLHQYRCRPAGAGLLDLDCLVQPGWAGPGGPGRADEAEERAARRLNREEAGGGQASPKFRKSQ